MKGNFISQSFFGDLFSSLVLPILVRVPYSLSYNILVITCDTSLDRYLCLILLWKSISHSFFSKILQSG